MVMKKGVKARKKRLGVGGGGGGSGSFPTNGFGAMSESHTAASTNSGLGHASATVMSVSNAFNGAPISGSNAPIEVADYIATVIQSETPIDSAGGPSMSAGVVTLPNCAGTVDVSIAVSLSAYNPTGISTNGGNCTFSIQNNPNSIGVAAHNSPVSLGIRNEALCRIDLATSGASAGNFIILEFQLNVIGKTGTANTGSTSAQAGAVKNGSMYLKIIFS